MVHFGRSYAVEGRWPTSVVRCSAYARETGKKIDTIDTEAMMVTRRGVLIAVGLAVAVLLEPTAVGAAQKVRKSKPATITLKVEGMT